MIWIYDGCVLRSDCWMLDDPTLVFLLSNVISFKSFCNRINWFAHYIRSVWKLHKFIFQLQQNLALRQPLDQKKEIELARQQNFLGQQQLFSRYIDIRRAHTCNTCAPIHACVMFQSTTFSISYYLALLLVSCWKFQSNVNLLHLKWLLVAISKTK